MRIHHLEALATEEEPHQEWLIVGNSAHACNKIVTSRQKIGLRLPICIVDIVEVLLCLEMSYYLHVWIEIQDRLNISGHISNDSTLVVLATCGLFIGLTPRCRHTFIILQSTGGCPETSICLLRDTSPDFEILNKSNFDFVQNKSNFSHSHWDWWLKSKLGLKYFQFRENQAWFETGEYANTRTRTQRTPGVVCLY